MADKHKMAKGGIRPQGLTNYLVTGRRVRLLIAFFTVFLILSVFQGYANHFERRLLRYKNGTYKADEVAFSRSAAAELTPASADAATAADEATVDDAGDDEEAVDNDEEGDVADADASDRAPVDDAPPPAVLSPAAEPAAVQSTTTLAQWTETIAEWAQQNTDASDYAEMGRRGHLFAKLWDSRHRPDGQPRQFPRGSEALGSRLNTLIGEAEGVLYPWLGGASPKYASVSHVAQTWKGRGIVLSTGNWHFRFARHAIETLRAMGCTLPIEVFYAGTQDLTRANIEELSSIDGVKVFDLSQRINLNKSPIGGWATKPFTMFASSFQEVIFMDSDTLFLQDPETMFSMKRYVDTGAVYFMDRTMPGDSLMKYMREVSSTISDTAKTTGRAWTGKSFHEADSGVVLIDKRRHLHTLLMVCMMNSSPYRDEIYKHVHGDKETFWLANEVMRTPYGWAPGGGGTIGFPEPRDPTYICGGLFHVDEQWQPLWFNGGLVMNKHTDAGKNLVLPLTHWAIDREMERGSWHWETDHRPFCFKPAPATDPNAPVVGQLSPRFLEAAGVLHDFWMKFEPDARLYTVSADEAEDGASQ